MPTLLDHVVVGMITILLPLHDLLIWYPRLVRAAPEAAERVRTRTYLESMVVEWGLLLVALWAWSSRDRTWEDLGLGLSLGFGFWVALAIALGAIAFTSWQRLALDAEDAEELRAAVRRQLRHLEPLLPHTPHDVRRFSLVSITAGVCEEVLYRGFLIWYLAALVPTVPAVLIAALLFGMAHAYQGTRGVFQTAGIGLVLAILYLISGSVWIPMLLHAFVDLNTGLLAYSVLREPDPDRKGSPPRWPEDPPDPPSPTLP